MKRLVFFLSAGLSALLLLTFANLTRVTPGFTTGSPAIKSINALAFGPDGILFVGDSKSAMIVAIDTKDVTPAEAPAIDIKNVDQKIASVLGTDARNVMIQDIAVNPISRKIYIAVQSADGTPVLLRLDGGILQPVSLKDISFSTAMISNPVAEDAKDRRGGSLRNWAISDMNFSDGKVMVTGLSNKEFGSTFRVIPFPFTDKQSQSSLEIYHAAHGRYETASPINTFTTAEINGKKYLVASYTCTPLVLFPMDELKEGQHVKGRTVGEFGAGNRPLDIISMKKDNDMYLIMANSDRPVMKVNLKDVAAYQGSLTEQVKVPFSTAGVPYISFPMTNVVQLDRLDDAHYVYIQRRSSGDLDMRTGSNEWF